VFSTTKKTKQTRTNKNPKQPLPPNKKPQQTKTANKPQELPHHNFLLTSKTSFNNGQFWYHNDLQIVLYLWWGTSLLAV